MPWMTCCEALCSSSASSALRSEPGASSNRCTMTRRMPGPPQLQQHAGGGRGELGVDQERQGGEELADAPDPVRAGRRCRRAAGRRPPSATGLARMASTASGQVFTASQTNRSGSSERSRKRRSAGTAARTRCRKSAPICRKKGLIHGRAALGRLAVTPHPSTPAERESHVPHHDQVARPRLADPRHA